MTRMYRSNQRLSGGLDLGEIAASTAPSQHAQTLFHLQDFENEQSLLGLCPPGLASESAPAGPDDPDGALMERAVWTAH